MHLWKMLHIKKQPYKTKKTKTKKQYITITLCFISFSMPFFYDRRLVLVSHLCSKLSLEDFFSARKGFFGSRISWQIHQKAQSCPDCPRLYGVHDTQLYCSGVLESSCSSTTFSVCEALRNFVRTVLKYYRPTRRLQTPIG